MKALRTNNAAEFAACMAFDAFRLCTGGKPRHFTAEEVVRWIKALQQTGKGTAG